VSRKRLSQSASFIVSNNTLSSRNESRQLNATANIACAFKNRDLRENSGDISIESSSNRTILPELG
jgi:hypothetical protein